MVDRQQDSEQFYVATFDDDQMMTVDIDDVWSSLVTSSAPFHDDQVLTRLPNTLKLSSSVNITRILM